ncbi:gephyrin-like molybdotransferase Glp [Agromyces lapidis]|uniref:Molybdopterin molybdenumtransferase n=1 Tax=Agromyces lapidis TaxID=279574 RepID=A0ABV5SUT5_9MICO|nr:gephyrin-like molybdotransferase Glp [Agromyces lapidis]
MISVDEYRARLAASLPVLAAERLPLDEALGAVLAETVVTRWPIPLFDNSAMDGYAVHAAASQAGARLRVVADLAAGSPDDPPVAPGEAVRIMTGAPMPSQADAVVPLEDTELGLAGAAAGSAPPDWVTVARAPVVGAHIRRAGEDASAGEPAVVAGRELGPWQLAAIASAGHEHVIARRMPRVAVLSTGSELVAPGAVPARGQIPESNSVLVTAALRAAGAVVVSATVVPDDEDSLRVEVERTLGDAATALDGERLGVDAVVLTGGAAVGAFDPVRAVLGAAGSVRFDAVALQPGRHQGFGVIGGTPVFCLPGNPVAVAVSLELIVRPALRAMAEHAEPERPRFRLPAVTGWASPAGRTQVVPVVVETSGVAPVAGRASGSHRVRSLAEATAFAVIPPEVGLVEAGDLVEVILCR